jgi:hypothetical protein
MDYYREAEILLTRASSQKVLDKADELFPSPEDKEEAHDFILTLLSELHECSYDDNDWLKIYQNLSELVFKQL